MKYAAFKSKNPMESQQELIKSRLIDALKVSAWNVCKLEKRNVLGAISCHEYSAFGGGHYGDTVAVLGEEVAVKVKTLIFK